jgi:multidrug resistance protein MdtO
VSLATSSTVTAPLEHGRLATFLAFLREELKPRPGRLQVALRITASAILALWVCMSFHLPAMGIALYLVFMVPRDSPSKAVKVLVLLAIVCTLAVVCAKLIISLGGDSPAVRFAGGAVVIFASMFMMQASTLGPVWMVLGLAADDLIRSWDSRYPAETTLEGNLWICLSLVTGFTCGVVVELLFGRRESLKVLREELAASLEAVGLAMSNWQQGIDDAGTQKKLDGLSLKGGLAQIELLNDAQSRYHDPSGVGLALLGTIQLGVFLVDQAASFQARNSHALTGEDRSTLPILIEECHSLAKALRAGRKPARAKLLEGPSSAETQLAGIRETLLKINGALNGDGTNYGKLSSLPKPGFLKPDAWSNKTYLTNALKVTAACCISYFIYSATDWSGINTIVTTCLITALSTVGEATEKQTLRIAGAMIGAICAFTAIIFIFPQLSTIAGLTVVVAIVTMLAAWVFLSSPRLSYSGVQIALCFFLATLTSTRTPTSLTQGRDRVVGILLGITVMWLVYDQISPVWTIDTLRGSVAKLMGLVAQVADLQSSHEPTGAKAQRLAGLRSSFAKGLTALRRKIEVHGYELIPIERHKKATVEKLNHVCDLLQRLFIAGMVAFEQDVAGTPPADNEIKAFPSRSKDELRLLIALLEGKTREEGVRDQFGESSPHSYASALADLGVTISDLLASPASRGAISHANENTSN